MRSNQRALRFCLVAVAGALAAAAAHAVIDVAGDYLLTRDAYDGIAHQSRALLLAAIGVLLLVAAIRTIFDALDRRCGSTTSLLALVRGSVGHPARFAAEATGIAIVALAGMESFDCLLNGSAIDDLGDVFGGSLSLGIGTVAVLGVACGWLVHRFVSLIAEYEAPIAALIVAAFNLGLATASRPLSRRRVDVPRFVARALLLSRQGYKRGPPRSVFG